MPDDAQTLAETAAKGDYVATLRALRDRLAREIDECDSARNVAVLSARLSDVLTLIATVAPPSTSKRDELARKRAERQRAATGRSDAADPGGAPGPDKRRTRGN